LLPGATKYMEFRQMEPFLTPQWSLVIVGDFWS
jgi:hypothetical protein